MKNKNQNRRAALLCAAALLHPLCLPAQPGHQGQPKIVKDLQIRHVDGIRVELKFHVPSARTTWVVQSSPDMAHWQDEWCGVGGAPVRIEADSNSDRRFFRLVVDR